MFETNSTKAVFGLLAVVPFKTVLLALDDDVAVVIFSLLAASTIVTGCCDRFCTANEEA
jgi:hypothetical protein